jgi:hypothetical protein
MIIRFLKSNNASAFFILPPIAIAIWALRLFSAPVLQVRHSMPFYEWLAGPVAGIPWLSTLIALFLVIAEAFLLNYIVNENEVLTKKSSLPGLFYIILMSNNSSLLQLHPIVFANLFLMFALSKMLNSYRKDTAFSQVFDAGLLISIASLFYFPCVVFFPVTGIALLIFRPFLWREWVISFIGVLVPYIFVITWYFWKDMLDYLVFDKIFYPIAFKKPEGSLPPTFYFMITAGWTIVLLSFGKLFSGLGGGSQKTKKALQLMLWLFSFAGLSLLLAPGIATTYFTLLAIPVAVICSNYFLRIKKELWGEILFLIFFISVFVNLVVEIF